MRGGGSWLTLALVSLALADSGCGKLMGSLRRDLDDSDPYAPPTVGGRWAERGFLSESVPEGGAYGDRYAAIGHSERSPSSLRGGDDRIEQSSWVSGEQAENNRRDLGRAVDSVDPERAVSFSSSPNILPPVRRLYKNGGRATRADFVDESPNEASLWASDGQINYYFTKNKIRGVGDIVTVNLDEAAVRDVGLEVRRTLTPVEKEREIALAEARVKAQIDAKIAAQFQRARGDGVATSAAAPDRAPAADGSAPAPDAATAPIAGPEIDVGKSLSLKAGEPMLAEIVERYPNGNYKIRGTKKVPYKNGSPRIVSLMGVVKASDIGDDDTVSSGKLYEYRLEANR